MSLSGNNQFVLPFKPQVAAVNAWLNELPIIDTERSSELVLSALRALNHYHLPPRLNIEIVETIRPLVFVLSHSLEAKFTNCQFPLEPAVEKAARLCIWFHAELARAYAFASGEEEFVAGKLFNRSDQARIIHRALQSCNIVMLRHYQIYTCPSAEFWQRSYRLYGMAEKLALLNLEIGDKALNAKSTINHLFKHLILFAISDTHHCPQRDMLKIYNLAEDYADVLDFQKRFDVDGQIAVYYFNSESDQPPDALRNIHNLEDKNNYYVCTRSVLETIINDAEKFKAAEKSGSQRLPNKSVLRYFAKRLKGPDKRRYMRLSKQAKRYFIIGFTNLLVALFEAKKNNSSVTLKQRPVSQEKPSTKPDYSLLPMEDEHGNVGYREVDSNERSPNLINIIMDESRMRVTANEIWNKPTDHSHRITLDDTKQTCQLINASANGYCLAHTQSLSIKIKVGDLIGVFEDIRQIEIGTIRWLRYSESNYLLFGVELLSPAARVVKIYPLSKPDEEFVLNHEGNLQIRDWALFFPSFSALDKPATLVTVPAKYKVGQWLVIEENKRFKKYHLKKALDSTSAFSHYLLFQLEYNESHATVRN